MSHHLKFVFIGGALLSIIVAIALRELRLWRRAGRRVMQGHLIPTDTVQTSEQLATVVVLDDDQTLDDIAVNGVIQTCAGAWVMESDARIGAERWRWWQDPKWDYPGEGIAA